MADASLASQRVLIVSASAGTGHTRAGEALLAQFQAHPGVAQVEHWDLLQYATPLLRYFYSRVYSGVVKHAPGLFGLAYAITDNPWKYEGARLAFERTNAGAFLRALADYKPDLVVSTHFTPPFLLSSWLKAGKIATRSAIVITDFDVHASWLVRHYDRFFCMREEARVYLEKKGIDPARITVSGIPIAPAFSVQKDKIVQRRQLGLDPDGFTILISAGGLGVARVEEMVRELFTLTIRAQIVAIAGKSRELKARLDAMAAAPHGPVALVAVGYTQQMDEYMAAADILISKPGGLTASEAMARGLPMCIMDPIPGQEERNAKHLLEAGAAIWCHTIPTLASRLERLVLTQQLREMRTRAQGFGKPDAAKTIVETLMGPAVR